MSDYECTELDDDFSVNKISSLKDFSHCHCLEELYIRKNCIASLSEIYHLKHLRNLRVLWLMDNPCADVTNYRDIILRNLPHLQKLDNTSKSFSFFPQNLFLFTLQIDRKKKYENIYFEFFFGLF